MIRLNDNHKTRLNERNLSRYYKDKGEYFLICIELAGSHSYLLYKSKEARDKDIELLDKIFDIKSIEDKANEEKPSYKSKYEPNYVLGDSQECEPEPVLVEQEYLTWDYVAEYNIPLKAKLPNGDIRTLRYEDNFDGLIGICTRDDNENYSACFYDRETFNALRLRRVE
jgi:hypothetical protein